MNPIYEVDFHPVGQGLFSSGVIDFDTEIFRFVYDCGTSSSRKLLHDALKKFVPVTETSIDLVAVSHFDQDHINGLEILLSKYNVKTLLLPYMNLDQRLVLAFTDKVDVTEDVMKFFVNPVKYLISKYEDKIENIVFVPSGEGENKAMNSLEGENLKDSLPGLSANLETDDEFEEEGISIYRLSPGGRLLVKKIFEFVPYNDASMFTKMTLSFSNAVKMARDDLLKDSGNNKNDFQAALEGIRDQYDKTFGGDAEGRNIISLFLFAGPISSDRYYYIGAWKEEYNNYILSKLIGRGDVRNCILYTGDGSLDTPERLRELISYLGDRRIQRIGCLQVMHHGAKGCWHEGVATALKPFISVFSSDPYHKGYGHPHAEVVRDFLPFSPVQVDKKRSLKFFVRH